MSSLLEEAIVDAKALKEAALKNAENAVLEKYSGEVKDAINTLLEQDELGLDETGLDETPEEGADTTFTEDVPFAFANEEIDGPNDGELIEIDFDQLKARIAEEETAGADVGQEDLTDALGMADEMMEEISDVELEDDAEEDTASIATGKYVGQSVGPVGIKEDSSVADEDIAITEEMLADLIEELVVDMIPRPQGWSSVNSADNSVEQANNDAMAAASAAHLEEEEIEDDASTASDVVSDAELYESKVSAITESNRELQALLLEAKYQLTKLNLEACSSLLDSVMAETLDS
jgi:hypothetical protein